MADRPATVYIGRRPRRDRGWMLLWLAPPEVQPSLWDLPSPLLPGTEIIDRIGFRLVGLGPKRRRVRMHEIWIRRRG